MIAPRLSSVHPSVCRLSTLLDNVSSETPIFFKLHVEPSNKGGGGGGGLKICTNSHGPLTKLAAMSIYGKNT